MEKLYSAVAKLILLAIAVSALSVVVYGCADSCRFSDANSNPACYDQVKP